MDTRRTEGLTPDGAKEATQGMSATSGVRVAPQPKTSRMWMLLALLSGVLVTQLAVDLSSIRSALVQLWPELLFWSLLVAVVNLFPVAVEDLYLTLDTPIVLAVAFLYPPGVAALTVLVATMDLREFRGSVPVRIALFNRVQTAITVFLASLVFHALAATGSQWWITLAATGCALFVDYLVNVVLIVAYQLQLGVGLAQATLKLKVGNPVQFLGIYLSYGALAVVLAELFNRVGPWSVLALMVPIFVARQALIRGQQLEVLNVRLMSRERLMEQLLDRSVDERRDERLRIGAELHDNVLQSIIKLWMLGQMLRKEVPPGSMAATDTNELTQIAEDSMTNLRILMKEMRESPLGRAGLVPTLESLVRDLRLDWGVRIELSADDALNPAPEVQVTLYQVAREAIVNALKHAKATRISVSLTKSGAQVILRVEDDGMGFRQAEVDSTLHFGIGLMRERVNRAKGKLSITSRPQAGTLVEVLAPADISTDTPTSTPEIAKSG
jgi:signal transduction histidine kinase